MKKTAFYIVVLALSVGCGGRASVKTAQESKQTVKPDAVTTVAPQAKHYTYKVVEVFPHDTKAYTQGLLWLDSYLYEGTGQNGRSELRKVETKSGRVLQRVKLPERYFGEGIAYLDGKIYQLTWTEGKAIVYDKESFRQLQSFSYDGEGWGLTTDGQKLYMSDGSEMIAVRDPKTFAVERTFAVTYKGRSVDNLNELEWVDGNIWANRYYTEEVAIIDPQTGYVTGIIDFSGIQAQADKLPDTDVFNGIAYDPATGNIYVTGKNWNKLYRVELVEVQGE